MNETGGYMKSIRLLTASLLFLLFAVDTGHAQKSTGRIGLGVIVGSPTGLSFKTFTSGTNAIDAGLAWSTGRHDAISIHADYLWHHFDAFEDINKGQLPVYYGIGGRMVFSDNHSGPGDDDVVLGVRIPVGINYLFEDSPVGLFLEIAPIVNLIPSTDFDLDGAIGARFYF